MIENTKPAHALSVAEPTGVWAASQRWLTLGLVLTVSGAAFEALAVATTLPSTVADLGGLELYGWAFSAFMLANLVGITIASSEADRQGPANPFLIGVALFTVGLLIAGLAPTMLVVIAGRAVQGLGGGFISSVAYVAIGRGYHESARPQMLAIISSAWVIPGLVGPAAGGFVADLAGWRWVFLGLAPLMPLAALLAWPALRRIGGAATQQVRDWPRVRAAVALAAGVGLAQSGLGPLPQPLGVLLVVLGLAIVAVALRRLLPAGSLVAQRGLPAAVSTAALLNLAFFGVDAFLPLALITVREQSAPVAGLALTAATVTWTTGAWIQARLATRVQRSRMTVTGLLLVAAGVVVVAVTLSPAAPALLATLGWSVAGLGIGLAFSTLALVALEAAPPGQEGNASASIQLANQLGVAVGTGTGGAIIGAFGEQAIASGILVQLLLMAGVAALAALCAARIE